MVVSFEVFKILFWPLSSGFAQPSACFSGKALVRKQCRGCRDWKHIGNALFLLLIKKWLQQFSKSCCYQDFSLDFWRSPGLASISDSGSFYSQQSGSWEKSCQAQSESAKMDNIEENGGSNVDPLNSSSSDQGTSVSSAASNIVQLISQQNAHQVGGRARWRNSPQ